MTDSITHASDTCFSTSAWMNHLILCFIQLLKVILPMNVIWMYLHWLFTMENFPFLIPLITVTPGDEVGVIRKRQFALLKEFAVHSLIGTRSVLSCGVAP